MLGSIFNSVSKGLASIADSLTPAESALSSLKWANTTTRKNASLAADQYRSTCPVDYLNPLPGESTEDWLIRRKHATNRIDFHLKARCLLYVFANGPTRTLDFEQDSGEKKAFWDSLTGDSIPRDPDDETPKYNALWARAQIEALYHGVVLLKSHYQEGEGLAPLSLIFRPWQFDVVVDPIDRRKFTAVKVLLNATDEEVAVGSLQPSGHQYEVWTLGEFFKVDDNWRILERKVNPYGRLPFIRIPSDPLWFSFFPPAYYDELVPACKAFSDLETEELDLAYNLYGQPVVKTDDISEKDKRRTIGKNTPQYVTGAGDYKRESPNADVKGFLDVKQDMELSFSMNKGVSPAIADWRVYAARDQSSLAVRAAQYGPLESRDADVEVWTRHELRLASLHSWVQATHDRRPVGYYLPTTYRLAFPAVSETVISEQDRISRQDMEIRNKITPRWKVAQENHPELTDEQAKAQVAEAEAEAQIQGTSNA